MAWLKTRLEGGSANDRFKRRARSWFWMSVSLAVVVHVLVLASGLGLNIREVARGSERDGFEGVRLASPTEVLEAPADIAAPAVPVVAEADFSFEDEIEFEPVDFGEELAREIPAPPSPPSPADAVPGYEEFVPSMVAPELLNPDEVRRVLEREYPGHLVSAGIGGRAVLWFWIDEQGRVEKYEIKESSGHGALDEAALRVVDRMEFSPALQHGQPTAVVVALPISFVPR